MREIIKIKKINDVVVRPLNTKKDDKPVWGGAVASNCYINVFLAGPTGAGKTVAIASMLKHCAYKKTKLVFFVSTFYNDDNYEAINDWATKKGLDVEVHDSIRDGKFSNLEKYIDQFTEEAKEEHEKKNRAKPMPASNHLFFDNPETNVDEEHKKKKDKYHYPRYIFVFDDLSSEVNTPEFQKLLKKARHFKIMTITSSQDVKDIKPTGLKQIRLWLLFNGLGLERIEHIHKMLGMKLPIDKFISFYNQAVSTSPYSFLYMCQRDNDYRINFDKKLIV